MAKLKTIPRRLLFNLVDIVWQDVFEDQSVPSTDHARMLIKKAIELTRKEKYTPNVIKDKLKHG